MAAFRPFEAEPRLIDVRDRDGRLVRRVPVEVANQIVARRLGEPVGSPMKRVILMRDIDAGAAMGLHPSSCCTWTREVHGQHSRVRHNTRACETFKK
jgi:hypothetical protein